MVSNGSIQYYQVNSTRKIRQCFSIQFSNKGTGYILSKYVTRKERNQNTRLNEKNTICADIRDTSDTLIEINFYYLRQTAMVMFSSFLVCLFLSLLTTLRKNAWTDFHEICRESGTWYKAQSKKCSGCSILPLEHRKTFPTFSEKSVSVSIRAIGLTDFYENLSKDWKWDKEQSGTFSGCCS